MEEQNLYQPQIIPAALTDADRRWPTPVRIFALIALIAAVFSFGYPILRAFSSGLVPEIILKDYLIAQVGPFIKLLFSVLAFVLFVTPTRNIPWLTAIPRTLAFSYTLFTTVLLILDIAKVEASYISQYLSTRILSLFLPFVTLLLYWLIVTLRPKSKALAIVYTVIALLWFIIEIVTMLTVIFDYMRIGVDDTYLSNSAIYNLISAAASLPGTVLFVLAAFNVPPKQKMSI